VPKADLVGKTGEKKIVQFARRHRLPHTNPVAMSKSRQVQQHHSSVETTALSNMARLSAY